VSLAKAILIIGKVCSGKTTYAKQLAARESAVVFNIDEPMLLLFGQHCEDFDAICEKLRTWQLRQTVEAVNAGVNVILDWGFWNRADRAEKAAFFHGRNVPVEWHYVAVSDTQWRERIAKRNRDLQAGRCEAYFVDPPLARKCEAIFEPPTAAEGLDIYEPNPHANLRQGQRRGCAALPKGL